MPVTLAGVVLAAGRGQRLRPLTDVTPKVLAPVGGRSLLDHALARLAVRVPTSRRTTAVNAHHHAGQVVAAVAGRAHVQVEQPHALGTAGALAALVPWLDGRDVLLTNGDVWADAVAAADDTASLVEGWDGRRSRLLVLPTPPGRRADFVRDGVGLGYVGTCLLPHALLSGLVSEPSGLYEVLWAAAERAGELDLVRGNAAVVDCGTPADYLEANLLATGGRGWVSPSAVVEGTVERCVVWGGALVGASEHLHDVIRAGTPQHPLTVSG
jgi:MurNAc alpha-1-phosphate uridylyltransferase